MDNTVKKLIDRFNGQVLVDEADLKKAIKLYYQMAGWDENGVPTKGTLWGLNLEWLPEAQ